MAPFLHYRQTNAQPCVVEVDRGELLELRGVSGPLKRRGRAGEIRTRGLLVPNRRLRPIVFGSIVARLTQRRASLLTHK